MKQKQVIRIFFKKVLLFPALLTALLCQSQPQQTKDSLYQLSAIDHAYMMKLLGITSLRPGVNGSNNNTPGAANYDEAKANPYPNLPDALTGRNGQKVTTAKQWWLRREEIVTAFNNEVYGQVPANTPHVTWKLIRQTDTVLGGIAAIEKQLAGHVDNTRYPSVNVVIQLTLTLPALVKTKVPVVTELSWPVITRRGDSLITIPTPAWQIDCLKRGWAFACILPASIQADNGAGLTQGIIGLMNKGERRKPADWGALRAWAWGASRVMDYFETDRSIDAKRVAIAGHSRYGKAALVTLAYDQRFAAGYISSSGEGGAKLHRRNAGEIVENVAASKEYHWMAGNFIRYAGPLHWNDLPVDAHELIALCAPRPVFIGCGSKGDEWADPKGMFMAAAAAGPVYQLLGKKGIGSHEFPAPENTLLGTIAFRQHSGGHTPDPNWPYFLDFLAPCFTDKKSNTGR